MGIGGVEAGILVLIVLVLFGPTLLAFWLGYVLGQKRRGTAAQSIPTAPATPPATEPDEPVSDKDAE